MSTLGIFNHDGFEIRAGVDENGEPWIAAADVAQILGHASAKDMVRSLDPEEKGGRLVPTPGGDQQITTLTEAGFYQALMQRQTGRMQAAHAAIVKKFQRWVTGEVLPSIRKTGQYGAPAVAELTRSDLARMILDAEAELAQSRAEVEAQTTRADAAEQDVASFESDEGLVVRAFIQKHFPDERESTLWTFFYSRGYVVNDPRGRWSDTQQKRVPGATHHMPLQPGREWFHAPEQLDRNRKPRRQLRVRRDRELALVSHLEHHGFKSLRNSSLDIFRPSTPLRAV